MKIITDLTNRFFTVFIFLGTITTCAYLLLNFHIGEK